MNITGKLDKIVVSVDKDRLESPLEEMAASLALLIKVGGVTDVEPLDRFAEVGFLGLKQEMIVVIHQAIGMNYRTVPLRCSFKVMEKLLPILLALKYRPLLITT